jgi:hypothetical protein
LFAFCFNPEQSCVFIPSRAVSLSRAELCLYPEQSFVFIPSGVLSLSRAKRGIPIVSCFSPARE